MILDTIVNGASGKDVRDTFNALLIDSILQVPSGDVAIAINNRLQLLAAAGGGILFLPPGIFLASTPIVVPSKCGIYGSGREATILRKATDFPSGATLVDMAGTTGDATGATHKTGMCLGNIQLSAGAGSVRTGLLLDITAVSVSTFSSVRLSGSPGTALMARETWDCGFEDLQINNCGGATGNTDAVIRILGSSTDKSNLLRFYNTRIETFPNCAIFIDDDGFGTNFGPYGVTFYGLKMESSILVDNATMFRSTLYTSLIGLHDVYIQMKAAVARTGIRGIDLDGGSHFLGSVQANVGQNVSVTSIVKIPRNSNGGNLQGPIRVTGATTLSMILEADAVRSDTFNVVYLERAMRIGLVVPFGSIPLIGGAGVDSAGYTFMQLDGTVSRTVTASTTVRRSDINRVIRVNPTDTSTPVLLTLPPEGDRFGAIGDTVNFTVENGGSAKLNPFNGTVIVQVASGKSDTISGQFTSLSFRKIAANTWRVI